MTKTNALVVKTPEGIVFSQLLAGPVTRFTAWLIDLVCLLVLNSAIGMVIGLLSVVSFGIAQAIQIILFFLTSIGYRIILEWHWRGQTIGKRLLRLRVVDAQGLRLQFSQIAIRNLLRFIDAFPLFYLVGGVACMASRRAQRLGDFAANTIVIRAPKLTEPDLEQLFSGKYNSFREYPHLEARLRQRVSATEASLALQALLRRDQLEPVARVELFSDIAGHLRSKAQFPADATDGITDEQYVRNVVDVLYRTSTGGSPGRKSDPSVASDKSDRPAIATLP